MGKSYGTTIEEAAEGRLDLGFGDVIPILRAGGRAARAAWKVDQLHKVYVQLHEGEPKMIEENGITDQWYPKWADLEAEDWEALPTPKKV